MKCEKCNTPLKYGVKYCRSCGEKVSPEALDTEYRHTVWGKLQNAEDWYSKLSLKKFTGHIIVKIVVLVAILAFGIFQFWQNGSELKILASEDYTVAYNKTADEYYIRTAKPGVNLKLFIPPFSDKVQVMGYAEDGAVLSEKSLSNSEFKNADSFYMEKGVCAFTTVRFERGGKTSTPVKLYITD